MYLSLRGVEKFFIFYFLFFIYLFFIFFGGGGGGGKGAGMGIKESGKVRAFLLRPFCPIR